MFGYSIIPPKRINKMRRACRLAAQTLDHIGERLEAGMTTDQVNTIVHQHTLSLGATPAPLNYRGFPKSVCVSVNEVVCHGIPGGRVLEDGDIVNVDVTHKIDGWYGDTSRTFFIGTPSDPARRVVEVAREALQIGIAAVRPGGRIGDIGAAIQRYVEGKECSVVRSFTGHGIGRRFHCEPAVPHYGSPGTGPRIKKNMCFTIEPMVNLGDPGVEILEDGWTAVTQDGTLSAQFEHTLWVGPEGVEVLTRSGSAGDAGP